MGGPPGGLAVVCMGGWLDWLCFVWEDPRALAVICMGVCVVLCRLDDIVNAIDDGSKNQSSYGAEPDFSDGGGGAAGAASGPTRMDEDPSDFQVSSVPPTAAPWPDGVAWRRCSLKPVGVCV